MSDDIKDYKEKTRKKEDREPGKVAVLTRGSQERFPEENDIWAQDRKEVIYAPLWRKSVHVDRERQL